MNKHSIVNPLADRILIDLPEIEKIPERKHGEIIIPEGVRAPGADNNVYAIATVIKVGGECKLVVAGDRIMIARTQSWRVKIGEVDSTFVREREIIAIMREEPSAV